MKLEDQVIFKLHEIVDRWEDKSKFFEIVGWYNKYQAPEIKLLEAVAEAAREISHHVEYCETIIHDPPGECDCGYLKIKETLKNLDEARRG